MFAKMMRMKMDNAKTFDDYMWIMENLRMYREIGLLGNEVLK